MIVAAEKTSVDSCLWNDGFWALEFRRLHSCTLVYFFAPPHPTTTSALHDTVDTGLAASDARTDLSTLAFLPPTQTLTTSSLPPPKPRRVYQLPASH